MHEAIPRSKAEKDTVWTDLVILLRPLEHSKRPAWTQRRSAINKIMASEKLESALRDLWNLHSFAYNHLPITAPHYAAIPFFYNF